MHYNICKFHVQSIDPFPSESGHKAPLGSAERRVAVPILHGSRLPGFLAHLALSR